MMMAGTEVADQVAGHCALVFGNEQPCFALTPVQYREIIAASWQVWWLADADDIEQLDAAAIMRLNGSPQRAAHVFVEQISQGHGSTRLCPPRLDPLPEL